MVYECPFLAFTNAQNRPVSDLSNQIHHHDCELCRIEDCRTPSSFECLAGTVLEIYTSQNSFYVKLNSDTQVFL